MCDLGLSPSADIPNGVVAGSGAAQKVEWVEDVGEWLGDTGQGPGDCSSA